MTSETTGKTADAKPPVPAVDDLVAEADTGGRDPRGLTRRILLGTALAWSLFQLWFASPLPFMFNFAIFNQTQARSIHLAFAMFLTYLAFPASSRSPRDHVPIMDWILALAGAFCGAYILLFYEGVSARPGRPILQDIIVGCVGIVLLIEAARRSLGPALAILAILFLTYTFAGPYMPGMLAHQGATLAGAINHQWITTEGVFGIALGVSTSFVFLFVLFGALLDRGGAGQYFIQVAFSLLGHLRGGPAKAAVIASAMTGLISGSSIANVVTTGTFTIPLMRRVGFSREKAGAVEVASSVNGQIMPPVMGAAAFLMVEFVGIPYTDVIKHALLPATISYIALVYIVHLEALKAGMQGLPKPVSPKPWLTRLIGMLGGFILICGIAAAVYYGLGWMTNAFGHAASWIATVLLFVTYLALLRFEANYPELEMDDPNAPIVKLPEAGPTVKVGLHYLLPVCVLVWTLMVERMSPGLSAFWATALMIAILLTQRPLIAMFRKRPLTGTFKLGFDELIDGLIVGARNMIGIGIATATAGIIVGTVTQTGIGSVMTDLVELISGGQILPMLMLTAVVSLILGMGLPTTANYIVVSALMAPVIVDLGAQSGLLVPLIAVHMFVFYFGIMADVTPPVGLASFAAAAVSGGDPMRTGFIAFFYSLRTALLPFLFIFNTDLLLINVDVFHGIFIFIIATIAMLLFAAATQHYFLVKSRIWESVVLLLIAFTLFRPGFWMDMIYPPFKDVPPTELAQELEKAEPGGDMRLRIGGVDQYGDPREFSTILTVPEGKTGADRLKALGLETAVQGDKVVVDMVTFDSAAEKAGLEWDQQILTARMPENRPPKELMFIPALLLLGLVVVLQRGRLRRQAPVGQPA
jgi:TRAP transporter 4TM/12TM fusion protein